jgi:hypothetical protein
MPDCLESGCKGSAFSRIEQIFRQLFINYLVFRSLIRNFAA